MLPFKKGLLLHWTYLNLLKKLDGIFDHIWAGNIYPWSFSCHLEKDGDYMQNSEIYEFNFSSPELEQDAFYIQVFQHSMVPQIIVD
jgi:hypothetical protein